jgi:cytochrome c oxidase subunit II
MAKELKLKHFMHKVLTIIFLIPITGLLLGSCTNLPASLNPQSGVATRIANLGWVMIVLGTVIWVGCIFLLLIGLFRSRRTPEIYARLPDEQHRRVVNLWVVGGGIIMTTLVLMGLIVLTVGTLRSIPEAEMPTAAVIEVIGHQWWWEVYYPDRGITLTDEIRIPAGQPVQVRLSSSDVIHSFWVPELHGKFDLVPGRTHVFILQADQPGEYPGRCAEFCGRSHAKMTFSVRALPPEEFTAWLDSQARSVIEPRGTAQRNTWIR